MLLRSQTIDGHAYLLLVESHRVDGRIKLKVIARPGRLDDLRARGERDRMLASLGRYLEKYAVLRLNPTKQRDQMHSPLQAARRLISILRVIKGTLLERARRLLRDLIEFDAPFYLAQYPDVANSGISPYEHYIRFGRAEGRIGRPPGLSHSERFEVLATSRKSVLVVSHDASRTGAPILCLNIARELRTKYNVVTLLLGGGSLVEEFRRNSDVVLGPVSDWANQLSLSLTLDKLLAKLNFTFAIVNSIESRTVLPSLATGFVPSITLIHEFAAYTRPRDAFPLVALWSTQLVFSTSLTRDEASSEQLELDSHAVHILRQGRCATTFKQGADASFVREAARVQQALRPLNLPEDVAIVLGVGSVQLRKGVDLFIDCAARFLRSNPHVACRFVWIGSGYDPDSDLQYSAYLADQICRAGLAQHAFILNETSNIDAAYKVADVLVVSSRLDPFPNIAIDAMAHGLPVVCFERATGLADFLVESGLGKECVAPFLDTEKMTRQIAALVESRSLRKEVGLRLMEIAAREFDLSRYVSQLEEIGLGSARDVEQARIDCAEIVRSGLARLDFYLRPHAGGETLERLVVGYVRSWASGIWRRKIFPGFHPGIFGERSVGGESFGDPLANYIRAGRPRGPWQCEVITPAEVPRRLPASNRVALHLHAYYVELLPDLLGRLAKNRIRPDLFVSAPSALIGAQVEEILRDYSGRIAEIAVVPNRGRDIGPFLTSFGRTFVDRYDFVGHLHTKKTVDVKDSTVGESWYRFLLENLLGGQARMADLILGRLADDPEVGIIFPDDPNAVGWGKNRSIAEDLAKNLGVTTLPRSFLFPVGTMFWARVESLRPLFDLELDWEDYPTEPLPYDGSVLHALERLISLVVVNRGGRILLTNIPGVTR